MLELIKVDLPKNKIVKVKKNNITYIYYILKSYRNEKGQPTSKTKLIGKLDYFSGKLIPNDYFFEVYDCDINIVVKGEKKHE